MAESIEVLDALPGCGKTHAIFDYMSKHQDKPWLYLSPLKDEVDNRVFKEANRVGMDFVVPEEGSDITKTEKIYEILKEGKNVACTHSLMLRFQDRHIEKITKHDYRIVCDEELNLISGYNIRKEDREFLIKHELIKVVDEKGMIEFTDPEMDTEARYGDVKRLADMGCLFAAKRNTGILVCQLSTKLIKAADRFILLSYKYEGSIMHTFLSLHGFGYQAFKEVTLFRSEQDIKDRLKQLLTLIETPSVKKVRRKYPLSKSWWENSNKENQEEVLKAMRAVFKGSKLPSADLFYTLPKNRVVREDGKSAPMQVKELQKNNFLACSIRATNEYANKKLAIHAYSLHPNQSVKAYLQDLGYECNDTIYALTTLIQWLWRGCIRNEEPMQVAILSDRMNNIFLDWLNK